LQAAKDIMDRAGLKPTERIENITVEKSTERIENITVEKSTGELRKELAQLMGSVTESGEAEEPVTLN